MTGRRLSGGVAAALVLALGGCGAGGGTGAPQMSQAPLLPGMKVLAEATQCDKGTNAFCGLELVLANYRYTNANQVFNAERRLIRGLGWAGVGADTGSERAAESPGNKLRITYATAAGDLTGIVLGWIHRSPRIENALSHALFDHAPAISVELDQGSS